MGSCVISTVARTLAQDNENCSYDPRQHGKLLLVSIAFHVTSTLNASSVPLRWYELACAPRLGRTKGVRRALQQCRKLRRPSAQSFHEFPVSFESTIGLSRHTHVPVKRLTRFRNSFPIWRDRFYGFCPSFFRRESCADRLGSVRASPVGLVRRKVLPFERRR